MIEWYKSFWSQYFMLFYILERKLNLNWHEKWNLFCISHDSGFVSLHLFLPNLKVEVARYQVHCMCCVKELVLVCSPFDGLEVLCGVSKKKFQPKERQIKFISTWTIHNNTIIEYNSRKSSIWFVIIWLNRKIYDF